MKEITNLYFLDGAGFGVFDSKEDYHAAIISTSKRDNE